MRLPASLELKGKEIIRGDKGSIAVIFNNLSGINFRDADPARSGTHADYLAYMRKELKVKAWQGELVRREGKRIVERFDFATLASPVAQPA